MPIFTRAKGISIYGGSFVDKSGKRKSSGPDRPGLEKLLQKSIPGAAHDSSDRYPPPLCHPGTRDELIDQLLKWRRDTEGYIEPVGWVRGPAGSGKSAICQSSADAFGDDLAASFFFSRPNSRSDPKRLFTTIAYQLATKCKPYGKLLDERIRQDPTIIGRSLPVQFQELIAVPFREALASGANSAGKVIIIDGLDECEGAKYQEEIIDIIAQSVINKTTPFHWIIASRLESHIVSKFNHPDIKPLTIPIEVTISRDLDPKIFRFLANKLAEIGRKHGLDQSWPREEDLHALVELSSGMFAYSHVISLFIDDPNSTSPISQLRLVLALAQKSKAEKGSRHPLEELDLFYTVLILERLPSAKRQAVGLILLVNYLNDRASVADNPLETSILLRNPTYLTEKRFSRIQGCANLLGYSEQEFRLLCQSFHAVMFIDSKDEFKFYHASFMDFLLDPTRSGQYCILSPDHLMMLLDHVKHALDDTRLSSSLSTNGGITLENLKPTPQLTWGAPTRACYTQHYFCLVKIFIMVLGLTFFGDHPVLEEERYTSLKEWDFRRLLLRTFDLNAVNIDIPQGFSNWEVAQRMGLIKRPSPRMNRLLLWSIRLKISALLRFKRPAAGAFNQRVFILGHGKKAVFVHHARGGSCQAISLEACFYDHWLIFKRTLIKKSSVSLLEESDSTSVNSS